MSGDTVSLFNGPQPKIAIFPDEDEEQSRVAEWIKDRVDDGFRAEEIGVFVRSEKQIHRPIAAVEEAGLEACRIDGTMTSQRDHVSVGTMHRAKGLEFRAVVVMACDEEVIPLQERIETIGDESELKEVYETERHLLYVACTRARDQLLITAVEPGSEFLDDMIEEARINV